MAYQALYRVYRPKTFQDMVGQDVITKTLENAIEQKQTGHAYLFSGPRGTGKTSAAKIFARAVNGISPDQAGASHPDIIEIDAASNNGVDEIRSIRDSANYAPIEAPFKIYIIDEAHMLSTGAFNALLKTLEEPPAQVKFILATTEIQKMPATILSRTQRFEFKRLANQTIKDQMVKILQIENQAFDEPALDVIASAAEGGMRDALSILDQVIAFGPEKITVDNALTVTGSVQIDQLLAYLDKVLIHETAQALEVLSTILLAGKDANRFLADLMSALRDIMLVEIAPDLVKSTNQLAELKVFNQRLNQTDLQTMLVTIDDIKTQLAQSLQSDIYLEILTVKLSRVGQESVSPVGKEAEDSPAKPAVKEITQPQVSQAPSQMKTDQPVETPATESVHALDKKETAKSDLADSENQSDEGLQNLVNQADQSESPDQDIRPVKQSPQEPVATPAPVESVALPTIFTGQEPVQAVLSQAKRESLTHAQTIWSELVQGFAVKDQAVLQTAEPMAASQDALILAFDFPAILAATIENPTLLAKLGQELAKNNLPEVLVLRTKDEWFNDRAAYVQALKSGQASAIKLSDLEPHMIAGQVVNKVETEEVVAEETQPAETGFDLVAEAKNLFGDDLVVVTDSGDEEK
ncbi:DNA polymerase III subunit gamma/tau [Fructobacillus ficulneus]|uniref:DNA-directed DNA polymerase n=1 Tax=Fructobacillus ficulneus TaxID=157463 RepID=A0A0K8MH34_9LACO|nr:DNA polymerase III subunit gamma/tau [Fructobacillus ficulneus]GAO99194.1 DNA polymerase III subunits gamma and tau [Fructobacillus ficulneus]